MLVAIKSVSKKVHQWQGRKCFMLEKFEIGLVTINSYLNSVTGYKRWKFSG